MLRIDPRTGGALLTVPQGADLDDAIAFLRRHEPWLAREQTKLEGPVPFRPGGLVPLRGEVHEVALHSARGPRVQTAAGSPTPRILVAGDADMVAIRLRRWLKSEARRDLEAAVARHAASLAVEPERVMLRDQRSRWGSCSSSGTLSFSWRLIMAPTHVLDYVAAHEVAHLRELNHGPGFWRAVGETGVDVERARRWLSRSGPGLHRYGATT